MLKLLCEAMNLYCTIEFFRILDQTAIINFIYTELFVKFETPQAILCWYFRIDSVEYFSAFFCERS